MEAHKRSYHNLKTKNKVGGAKLAGERFEIFKDAVGKFRFRLRAKNGEIIAESQGYESKERCQKGIARAKIESCRRYESLVSC
jgi:uncharacterized protein YegP (UPF0339 family)